MLGLACPSVCTTLPLSFPGDAAGRLVPSPVARGAAVSAFGMSGSTTWARHTGPPSRQRAVISVKSCAPGFVRVSDTSRIAAWLLTGLVSVLFFLGRRGPVVTAQEACGGGGQDESGRASLHREASWAFRTSSPGSPVRLRKRGQPGAHSVSEQAEAEALTQALPRARPHATP